MTAPTTPTSATSVTPATAKTEYSAHPLSEIFPRLGSAELGFLAEDIKATKLREPIWLYEDKILDGNNRYRACLKIGYPLKEGDFRQFDPKTQGDPLSFVVSANLHRRHLNESQRAGIAAGLVNSKLGYNQYNNGTVSNEKAATLLGVSVATVKMAKDVAAKAAPEIVEAVRKGELRLGAAMPLLKVPKAQQVAALAARKAEAEAQKATAAAAVRVRTKANKPKPEPEANQKMTALDDFKTKWSGFDEMQRKAFVMIFEVELAGLLEYVREQKALAGGTTVNQDG